MIYLITGLVLAIIYQSCKLNELYAKKLHDKL